MIGKQRALPWKIDEPLMVMRMKESTMRALIGVIEELLIALRTLHCSTTKLSDFRSKVKSKT
jgi:hypothetical protein